MPRVRQGMVENHGGSFLGSGKKMNKHSILGMTLIELLVVVVIVAIISAVAFPAYQDQVRKSRRSDARAALASLALAQERFYTISGNYASSATSMDVSDDLQGGNSENGYYALSIPPAGYSATAYVMTAKAQNGQEQDTDCQVFLINQLGVKTSSSDATATTINTATDSGCW